MVLQGNQGAGIVYKTQLHAARFNADGFLLREPGLKITYTGKFPVSNFLESEFDFVTYN